MVRALALAFAFMLVAPGVPLALLSGDTSLTPEAGPLPGESEMGALAAAWPDRISETSVRDGEWMLRIDDDWYAWAHGRLLPEAERSRWEEFAALSFSPYPATLPPVPVLDEEAAARVREHLREEELNPPRRSEAFLGRLLLAGTRAETEKRMVTLEVAGFTVTVHERLKGPLSLVSEELRALRKADPSVAAFLRGLREMNGYNYRYVEGTRSRSFHSYGIAVDLIPRSYGGKHAYWMWAMISVRDWWAIPYEERWMVPEPVVEVFERHGFVWGGKWLFFDTMHFDYRPDVLLTVGSGTPEESGG